MVHGPLQVLFHCANCTSHSAAIAIRRVITVRSRLATQTVLGMTKMCSDIAVRAAERGTGFVSVYREPFAILARQVWPARITRRGSPEGAGMRSAS